jgi:DNA-binding CsgD family transcriptional regulator
MGRERREQPSSDLFSTAAARDASALSTRPSTTGVTAEPGPQRHVLPKNLRAAVKHLSDGELDLLHAATLQEMKRRGRPPPSVEADSAKSSAPLGPQNKQSPPTGKISRRRRVEIVEVSLTRGQVNAVRSAFKAGITPARIARQFGISQSNVRKALASDEPKW